MAQVTVNVNAKTGEATQEINNLDNALNDADASAEKLNDSLESQEKRIKTLSGAINIVGGSVELLAGSLALSGALTEEQVAQFEAAAVGAIAFADGAKRIFEGYKELSEATKLATAAQKANNLAVLANPYVAAAAALAALTAGIYLFVQSRKVEITEENRRTGALNEARKAAEKATIAQDEFNRALEIEQNRVENSIKVLKAQGATIEEIFEAEKALALTRIANAKLTLEEERRQNEELEKAVTILEETERATGGVTESTQATRDALEKNKDEVTAATTALDDLNTELTLLKLNYQGAQRELEDQPLTLKLKVETPSGEETPMTLSEYFEKETGAVLANLEGAQLKTINLTRKTTSSTLKVASDSLFAYAETAEYAVGDTVAAFGSLFSSLSQITGEGNEEAFEAGKKYKIAEVITSSTQAAFQAFAAAQQFGPILGPIIGAAQVAAIGVAASRAISDIRTSQFDGGSSTPGDVSTAGTPTFGIGTSTIQGATGTVAPSTPSGDGAVRAYVLSSDVANGLEANSLLRQRRQFP